MNKSHATLEVIGRTRKSPEKKSLMKGKGGNQNEKLKGQIVTQDEDNHTVMSDITNLNNKASLEDDDEITIMSDVTKTNNDTENSEESKTTDEIQNTDDNADSLTVMSDCTKFDKEK